MDLSTFFQKFDQFADAPDAVAKLRELVLELAASGRLVPEALERPVEEDTKLMGPLVELVMGQAPAGTECNTEGRGTVFVKVGEFGPLYPHEEVWTTDPLKFAKKGDVLVCVVGATVGKLNLAIDCAIGRSVAAIRPSPALGTKFLYYSLIPYTLHLRRNSRGSAQGVIGKAELNAVSLWVPGREVQQRIVAKVDELMALCDRLEAQQQERETRAHGLARASLARFAAAPTPANLTLLFHSSFSIPPADLRKSILTLAVQGHLKSEAGDSGFPQVRLDSLGEWAQGCGFPLVEQGHADRPILFSKVSDMNLPGNEREIRATNHTIDEATAKRLRIKVHPAGTVIFPKIGGAIATNKRRVLVRPTAIDNNCSGIIPNKTCSTAWVFLVLSAIDFAEYQSGTSVPAVNQGALGEINVSLPPLAEQRRIVAKVEQLMALVDALEQQLAASRATAEKLLTALVADLTKRN